MKVDVLKFDVMSDGRFIDTMSLLLTKDLVKDVVDGVKIWYYKEINRRAEALVLRKRPSLKYKAFQIIAQ